MDRANAFINKWIGPVTLIAILGALVWNVQQITRLTVIIDSLERRIAHNEKVVEDHNKEAEAWKRRILLNEKRN